MTDEQKVIEVPLTEGACFKCPLCTSQFESDDTFDGWACQAADVEILRPLKAAPDWYPSFCPLRTGSVIVKAKGDSHERVG